MIQKEHQKRQRKHFALLFFCVSLLVRISDNFFRESDQHLGGQRHETYSQSGISKSANQP